MKIAMVHNEYGRPSGEEVVVDQICDILSEQGHKVVRFTRKSAEWKQKWFGRTQALLSGLYNPFARAAFQRFLRENRPDVVHLHNLFPWISPSVVLECWHQRVPAIMTLHNYRLLCPNALMLRRGGICHECLPRREWKCVWHNCEGNLPRSIGYALRTAFSRRFRWFEHGVQRFLALTQFQKDRFVEGGFSEERLLVVPNPAPIGQAPRRRESNGEYIGYVGRVSPEKDVPLLLEAARRMPGIPFKIAGDDHRMPTLRHGAPPNVEFCGYLTGQALEDFWAKMRVMTFATRCYEAFPTVLLEAMTNKVPIVCTRLGGLSEIVPEGGSALFYEPGNVQDLVRQLQRLWHDSNLRCHLADAAFQRVYRAYSPEVVGQELLKIYEEARLAAR